jgi:hypothetical protein
MNYHSQGEHVCFCRQRPGGFNSCCQLDLIQNRTSNELRCRILNISARRSSEEITSTVPVPTFPEPSTWPSPKSPTRTLGIVPFPVDKRQFPGFRSRLLSIHDFDGTILNDPILMQMIQSRDDVSSKRIDHVNRDVRRRKVRDFNCPSRLATVLRF